MRPSDRLVPQWAILENDLATCVSLPRFQELLTLLHEHGGIVFHHADYARFLGTYSSWMWDLAATRLSQEFPRYRPLLLYHPLATDTQIREGLLALSTLGQDAEKHVPWRAAITHDHLTTIPSSHGLQLGIHLYERLIRQTAGPCPPPTVELQHAWELAHALHHLDTPLAQTFSERSWRWQTIVAELPGPEERLALSLRRLFPNPTGAWAALLAHLASVNTWATQDASHRTPLATFYTAFLVQWLHHKTLDAPPATRLRLGLQLLQAHPPFLHSDAYLAGPPPITP